jgi:hypothetical protein
MARRGQKAFKSGIGGGTAVSKPSPKPKPITPMDPMLPPSGTYDPVYGANIRAGQRGLEDKLADIKTKRHFGKRDLVTGLRTIRRDTSRSRGGMNRDFARTMRDYGEKEGDLQQKAGRAREDFSTQLANIGRQFQQLGHRQREGSNASGVIHGGTEAAASVARQRNQTLAEAPVHTASQRMEEDLATALRRYGEGRAMLADDRGRGLRHLHSDRDLARKLRRRQFGRDKFLSGREEQQAIREQGISAQDLAEQSRFDSRQRHPAAFKRRQRQRRGR